MESKKGTTNTTEPAPAQPWMHYSKVRLDIHDGDVLLWRGHYAISTVFRLFTGSWYTHAAIAVWWGERLMILQAEPVGLQAVPLSSTVKRYDGLVDWYKIKDEYRNQIDVDGVLTEAKKDLGLPFGTLAAFRSSWNRFLHISGIVHRRLGFPLIRSPRNRRAMFCSQYVSRCFRAGGLPLTSHPDIDTLPGDVARSDLLEFQTRIHDDPHTPKSRRRHRQVGASEQEHAAGHARR
jgi:hypothetical protein